jgi:fatty-acyl-CoA synthase
VVVGGAVTSPETKARLLDLLDGALLLDAAGASETGSALAAVSMKGATTEAGIFDPNPSTVVLSEAKDRVVAAGEDVVGWFAKRGRIPLGYLGDQAKTEATFPVVDGVRWAVPGDRARLRADGKLELLGRDSVTINTGGEKVFAEEVEAAVLTHPAVRDCIVVGRPSERWGSEVVAVVELGEDATDEDILAAAAERIARYKLPKAIVRVPTVLRSPAGKADYRWGRDVASAVTT